MLAIIGKRANIARFPNDNFMACIKKVKNLNIKLLTEKAPNYINHEILNKGKMYELEEDCGDLSQKTY